jgi:aminopeptidase N
MSDVRKIQWILMCVLVLWVLPGDQAAAQTQPVLKHHLTVRLDPSGHRLQAKDRLEFSASGSSSIEFRLAEHLAIENITVNNEPGRYKFQDGRLEVGLPPKSGPVRLEIDYTGRFDDPAPEQPLNTENPGYGVTGTIQDRGTMLLAGAGWYPAGMEWAEAFDLTVDAPEGTVAVTAGRPLGHTSGKGRTLSRWAVAAAPRGLVLVAGPYKVATRAFGDVTAATYFTPALQHLSAAYLEAAGRYLQFYQERFGPYAFGQFAVVENFFPTGYGFPSFTLMGRQVLQLPFIIHTSLGHEIAHCWWGNGVLVDPTQGNWSEGLTTYVSDYLYKERNNQGRDQRLQWLRDYAELVNPAGDFPLSRFTHRTDPATRTVGYGKGAMVFHMLRRTVGDVVFWQSLRDIYARHRFEAVSWSDIQSAFEHRGGVSLHNFFQQWVFRAGAPRLSLDQVTVASAGQGYRVRGRVDQRPPFFDLNLELALQTDAGTVRRTVSLAEGYAAFSMDAPGRPTQLTVDPDVQVFRRLDPGEIPPTINTIKGSASLCVVVARSQGDGGLETAGRLTTALGRPQASIVMEDRVSPGDLEGKDLILLGRPGGRIWRPAEGSGFAFTADGFALNGSAFEGEGLSFFGVFNRHGDQQRSVALFLPAGSTVANIIAAKVPHYGKYSYLVFQESSNRAKGTWDADASPLTVRWPETTGRF